MRARRPSRLRPVPVPGLHRLVRRLLQRRSPADARRLVVVADRRHPEDPLKEDAGGKVGAPGTGVGPVALEEAVPVRVGLPGGTDRGHGGWLGQVGKGHVAVVQISLGTKFSTNFHSDRKNLELAG